MKLIKLLCASTLVLCSATALADPAENVYFNATSSCFDEFGGFLITTTERHMIVTNNGKGTVNLIARGACPTSSKKAVKWTNFDYPGLFCNGGSEGGLPFWKYHMRPDGRYTLKCSNHPIS